MSRSWDLSVLMAPPNSLPFGSSRHCTGLDVAVFTKARGPRPGVACTPWAQKKRAGFGVKISEGPWPIWLSWMERCPAHQKVAVRFLVGTHTQVAGLIPGQGVYERQRISVSPPLPLSKK